MRRPLLVVAVVLAGLGRAPAGAVTVPVVTIEGRGHGHGVGMAQDGAYWMGRAGANTAQILNQFYPGTTFGRSAGEVRVSLLSTGGNVVVAFPGGGEVRDGRDGGQSSGFPVRVGPGGQARIRFDGRQYMVEVVGGGVAAAAPGGRPAGGSPAGASGAVVSASEGGTVAGQQASTTTTTGLGLLPGPGGVPLIPLPSTPIAPLPSVPLPTSPTTPPSPAPPAPTPAKAVSSRALWAVPAAGGTIHVPDRAHRYRGVVQVVGAEGPGLRLVNHVDVEQYLRGMGEVRNPSWPPAALRAQAIAARTYAMRAVSRGGELCDSQQCQVYLGAEAEYAAMDKAVAATRGQVLMFGRALASAVYSANGGGFSASTEEGFGTPSGGYPYLRPAKYPTSDPSQWTVTVALRDVAARVGYRGRVTGVKAQSAGPSGRVLQVTVEGSAGPRTVSGIDFDRALGLKSTMFSFKLAEATTAPPPPPPPEGGAALQGLPGGDPAVAPPPGDLTAAAPAAGAARSARLAQPPAPASSTDPARLLLACVAWLLLAGVAAGAAGVRLGSRGPGPSPPSSR